MDETSDIEHILKGSKTIAVVGLSDKPDRISHEVARFLQSKGYRILPVNPTVQGTILGETVYPDLLSLPLKPDVVDVFRRPEDIGPVMAQAIQIKAPVFWMQLGISNEPEAEKGRKAGMTVIQDRCMMSEWKRRWGD